MPSGSSTRSQRGCDPALDRDTDVIKDDPEVLPMFREAMKQPSGTRNDLRSNPTEVTQDRGKAYTLTRLQKDNPEIYEEVKAGKLTANAGTHTQAEAAREVGISHPAVIKAVTRNKVTSKKVTKAKPSQPTIKLADPHRTAAKLRGMLYISRKKSVGAPDGNKNRKSKSYQSDNFETEQKTHEVVAKETGVSPATIMRDAAYAEAAS
jgi:hypothetical protein